jgi:dTDP-4-dehydrorhamnose 3,5-epimerase-like enzyme
MQLVQIIQFPYFTESNGDLVVIEDFSKISPFSIARVFNVRADLGVIRGKHAHHNCSQLLICTNGAIEVMCDNNNEIEIFLLNKPNLGLLISPGVWAEQKYLKENSVLTVLCDQFYDEDDYVRSYSEFLSIFKSN